MGFDIFAYGAFLLMFNVILQFALPSPIPQIQQNISCLATYSAQ
jgi:hypothetical protein